MLFLLLPLILNPFGFLVRWLPALYLGAWPIIIHTLGQEALMLHAVILIMFILCCDVTRALMLRLIGFDLISLPAGVALLAFLLTDKGTTILSYIIPLCSGLLVTTEPIFLLLETLIVMDMIRALNRWISRASNIRDEESSDLSSWEPPLTRGSILMRIVVILIAAASYISAYMLVQESKSLLGVDDKTFPIQFNQAIALLVTLQLIAFTTTIYKEEGILSESAMVALLAAVPIFVASWSFYNLKTAANTGLGWSSLFPFSLFAGTGSGGGEIKSPSAISLGGGGGDSKANRIVFGSLNEQHEDLAFGSGAYQSQQQLDYGALEQAIHLIAPADNFLKTALLVLVRQLIMLINSILGLSWAQLAKYYFGPDFWYVLAGRLVCLIWWLLLGSSHSSAAYEDSNALRAGPSPQAAGLLSRIKRFGAGWPLSRTTLIKCLIVLAYAQMLIQQMENKNNLADQTNDLLLLSPSGRDESRSCCSDALADSHGGPGPVDGPASWLSCMWESTKACSGSSRVQDQSATQGGSSRASRYLSALTGLLTNLVGALLNLVAYAFARLTSAHLTLGYIYTLWLSRWRSPIIQRLMQSVFIQFYYICSTLFGSDEDEDEDDF